MTRGERFNGGGLLQERVAAGDHDDVEVGGADAAHDGVGDHRADADGPHDTLGAELLERGERLGHGEVEVVALGVVQVDHVDAIEPHPLKRLGDARADAVGADIPLAPQRRRNVEVVVEVETAVVVGVRAQQAPDLRGDHVLVARLGRKERAQPALGQPEPVMRRGVEVADAALPRRLEDGERVIVAHRAEEVADVGGAVAERGQRRRARLRRRHARPSTCRWRCSRPSSPCRRPGRAAACTRRGGCRWA